MSTEELSEHLVRKIRQTATGEELSEDVLQMIGKAATVAVEEAYSQHSQLLFDMAQKLLADASQLLHKVPLRVAPLHVEPFRFWELLLVTGVVVLQVFHLVGILLEGLLLYNFYFNEEAARINPSVWACLAIFLSVMLSVFIVYMVVKLVNGSLAVARSINQRLQRPNTPASLWSSKMKWMVVLLVPNYFVSHFLWNFTREPLPLVFGIVFASQFT